MLRRDAQKIAEGAGVRWTPLRSRSTDRVGDETDASHCDFRARKRLNQRFLKYILRYDHQIKETCLRFLNCVYFVHMRLLESYEQSKNYVRKRRIYALWRKEALQSSFPW